MLVLIMKKFIWVLITIFLFISNIGFAELRFGELTEMRDERMRGKDNQWVRPHPGPFVWNNIFSCFLDVHIFYLFFWH